MSSSAMLATLVWLLDHQSFGSVLYDGFTVSCGGITAPLIIARPLQCLIFIKIIKLVKKLFLNCLTAKFVLVGTKNSHLEGFWLAKQTAHKHPHHDGAVCLSSGMVFMEEHTPPPRASVEGFGQGHL
jgi:hypothetical protein